MAPSRSQVELARHEQRCLIEAYLRLLTHEDTGTIGTTHPSQDGGSGPRPIPWASYESYVDRKLARFPLHLLTHCPDALRLLPWAQQEVLHLTLTLDLDQATVAVELRRSIRWVRRQKSDGLTALAELLWAPDGHPRMPATRHLPAFVS